MMWPALPRHRVRFRMCERGPYLSVERAVEFRYIRSDGNEPCPLPRRSTTPEEIERFERSVEVVFVAADLVRIEIGDDHSVIPAGDNRPVYPRICRRIIDCAVRARIESAGLLVDKVLSTKASFERAALWYA